MQLSKGEAQAQAHSHSHSRRRSNSCLGWHCLSSVTHFGIIFSIVVTVLILSVVWMYCLGRARIFRKQTEPQNVPNRQRTNQHHHHPETIARPVPPPIVQQVPVFNYAVPQQTLMYFFPGPQFPTTLPPGVMNAHVQLPAPPIFRPQEAPYPPHPGGMASGLPKAHEYHQAEEPPDNVYPSRQPTWWQRFYRAFTLPVGDASTVASSSSPEPSERSQAADFDAKPPTASPHTDGGHKVRVENQGERKDLELPINDRDDTSSMLCNLDTSSDSLSSIRSDAATVHSDDFETPPRRG